MTLSTRQKFGMALVLISLLGAVIIQAKTGDLVHVMREAEAPIRGPLFSTQTTFVTLTVAWRYAVPIAACAALGLCCLLVPPRPAKPRP